MTMTSEQKKAAFALANAIDLFLHGGINRGAELPDLLRSCEELEIGPDDLQELVGNVLINFLGNVSIKTAAPV